MSIYLIVALLPKLMEYGKCLRIYIVLLNDQFYLSPWFAQSLLANAFSVFVASAIGIGAVIGTVENRERGVEPESRIVRVEDAQDAGMSLDDGLVLTSAERTEQTSFRRPRIRHESIKNNCFRKYKGNRELSVHYTHMSDMKTISRHLLSLISPQLKKYI
jgi:hypothetical protein